VEACLALTLLLTFQVDAIIFFGQGEEFESLQHFFGQCTATNYHVLLGNACFNVM
jgi:hypothetical protein